MGLELFSNRIKELRNMMGYTQKQFADEIKITAATLSAYENNAKKPSLNVLVYIAERFTVSLDWLCGLSEIIDPGDKPKKYSELISALFKLEESNIYFKRNVHIKLDDLFKNYNCIAFNDPVISLFLESWDKSYKLYSEGIIDKTIYTAWKEKILKDFNENIMTTIGQSDEFNRMLPDFAMLSDYDKVLTTLHHLNHGGYHPE